MATINKSIAFNSDLFYKATQGTTNTSKRINDLIEKGLLYEIQEKNTYTVNECIELLWNTYNKQPDKKEQKETKKAPDKRKQIGLAQSIINLYHTQNEFEDDNEDLLSDEELKELITEYEDKLIKLKFTDDDFIGCDNEQDREDVKTGKRLQYLLSL